MVLKDKKVLVVGLARSGSGAARLLSLTGAEVKVTDKRKKTELSEVVKGLGPSVKLALGGHPEEVFNGSDLIVVSPGVPLEIGPIASARAKGIPVIGELELAYQFVMSYGSCVMSKDKLSEKSSSLITHHSSPFLAITGSNGKSTTTTLLDHMMRKAGFNTMLGGNIGNALTEEICKAVMSDGLCVMSKDKEVMREGASAGSKDKLSEEDASRITHHASPDFIVVEVSSFQLDAIDSFRPHIASILNVTPDHMDRYHSLTAYRDSKANIYLNQKDGDYLVLNADDPGTLELYDLHFRSGKQDRPRIYFFSRTREVEGIYSKAGKVYCNIPEIACNKYLIDADEIRIRGVHNLENAMAASAMALLANCPPEAVTKSLKEFGGLEHRLELVRELDGVKYINDSKGTNTGAVVKSIESFTEPLVLIAGGRDKAGDFSLLRGPVSQKVKAIILIGEASGKIKDALGDITETVMAKDLAEAVTLSRQMSGKGGVVLLSPACASFDMFRDYEDRGRQFKKLVMELKGDDV
jgi:UDP-N-acetylmuramoylalanine--D-glutamate ligase